jgi:hypothetical protein
MMARHLQLIGPYSTLDARAADIYEAFQAVWGSNPDPIEVQHRDALIDMGVTPERAQMEFTTRRLRQLREA